MTTRTAPDAADWTLLRTYEPVLRLTQGELFRPSDVADYVSAAALYRQVGKEFEVLVPHGQLALDALAEHAARHPGTRLSLQGLPGPLGRRRYRAWRRDPARPRFQARSRFAAVGLVARLLDTVARLTLLARGRVPGGYTAAAHVAELATRRQDTARYYGHVSREAGWIALQYWFFYRMNDWRSSFGGVNDHEADWEQVTILLAEPGDGRPPVPSWVAFSSHDEVGDDLRRRWDDPDMQLVDDLHPVVYAGAGSHSGAYLPGEYLVSVPVPLPEILERLRKAALRILPWTDPDALGVAVPYIDYRRGDGDAIGPGQAITWDPVLIDDDVPWVRDYRGLWGLDTRDPLGGERAPAGPRYERDGRVRASWRSPVSWTGLDKECPTPEAEQEGLLALRRELEGQLADVDGRVERTRALLRGGRLAERAVGRSSQNPGPQLRDAASRLAELRDQQASLVDLLEGVRGARRAPAPREGVHAHLRHRAVPLAQDVRGHGRLLRVWSAASASLLLAALGVVLIWRGEEVLQEVLVIAVVMLGVEAAFRRRLLALAWSVAVAALAGVVLIAVALIVVGNLRLGVGVLLLLAALYMATQTLREGLLHR